MTRLRREELFFGEEHTASLSREETKLLVAVLEGDSFSCPNFFRVYAMLGEEADAKESMAIRVQ